MRDVTLGRGAAANRAGRARPGPRGADRRGAKRHTGAGRRPARSRSRGRTGPRAARARSAGGCGSRRGRRRRRPRPGRRSGRGPPAGTRAAATRGKVPPPRGRRARASAPRRRRRRASGAPRTCRAGSRTAGTPPRRSRRTPRGASRPRAGSAPARPPARRSAGSSSRSVSRFRANAASTKDARDPRDVVDDRGARRGPARPLLPRVADDRRRHVREEQVARRGARAEPGGVVPAGAAARHLAQPGAREPHRGAERRVVEQPSVEEELGPAVSRAAARRRAVAVRREAVRERLRVEGRGERDRREEEVAERGERDLPVLVLGEQELIPGPGRVYVVRESRGRPRAAPLHAERELLVDPREVEVLGRHVDEARRHAGRRDPDDDVAGRSQPAPPGLLDALRLLVERPAREGAEGRALLGAVELAEADPDPGAPEQALGGRRGRRAAVLQDGEHPVRGARRGARDEPHLPLARVQAQRLDEVVEEARLVRPEAHRAGDGQRERRCLPGRSREPGSRGAPPRAPRPRGAGRGAGARSGPRRSRRQRVVPRRVP